MVYSFDKNNYTDNSHQKNRVVNFILKQVYNIGKIAVIYFQDQFSGVSISEGR